MKGAREKWYFTCSWKTITSDSIFLIWLYGGQNVYNIFQGLKESTCQPRILYWAKISSVMMENKDKSQIKGKLRECVASRPTSKGTTEGHAWNREEMIKKPLDMTKE